MKNKILFLLLFLFSTGLMSQVDINDAVRTAKEIAKDEKKSELLPRWIQTAEIEMSLPSSINYRYSTALGGKNDELKNRLSFGAFYTINYPVFKKLTIGVIGGVQHQSQGSLTGLKLGGILRYYLVNYDGVNIYFMTARSIAISDKIRNRGGYGNARLGLQFRIEQTNDYNITMNLFWDNDSYSLKKPLINNEIPINITYHGNYGIGMGFSF